MANFKALDHGGPVNCNKTQSSTEHGFDQGMSLIKPSTGLIRVYPTESVNLLETEVWLPNYYC